jgi:hypothetical protein
MRPRSDPVRISIRHYDLHMKAYRSCLLEYKFNLKVKEIEETLAKSKTFKPRMDPKKYCLIYSELD